MKQRSKGVDGGNFALRGSRGTWHELRATHAGDLLLCCEALVRGRVNGRMHLAMGGNRRQSGGLGTWKAMFVNRRDWGYKAYALIDEGELIDVVLDGERGISGPLMAVCRAWDWCSDWVCS